MLKIIANNHLQAFNTLLPELTQETSVTLTVHYLPQVSCYNIIIIMVIIIVVITIIQVTLVLGSSISAASVKEGEDIYLECGVQVGIGDFHLLVVLNRVWNDGSHE